MKYFYKKYTTNLSAWSSEIETHGSYTACDSRIALWNRGVTWNWSSGTYTYDDSSDWAYQETGFKIPDATKTEASFMYLHTSSYNDDLGLYIFPADIFTRTRSYVKGSFIETIEAEEGTYPIDGRHTDGFWYVKSEVVMSAIYLVLPNEKLIRIPLYQVIANDKLHPRYAYQVIENEKLKKL